MQSPRSMGTPQGTLGDDHTKRRRPHRKSRTGCIDCRKRRVKCGEELPTCRSCVRRGVPCQYPGEPQPLSGALDSTVGRDGQPTSNAHRSRGSWTATQIGPTASGVAFIASETPLISDTGFGIGDLALLHHWTLSTSLTIIEVPKLDTLWRVMAPQIGFQHTYVAHAILSLAGLHLSYLDSQKTSLHITKATHHHNEGLRGFQQAVGHVTKDNSEALFIWSMLNIVYVFGVSAQLEFSHNVDRDARRDMTRKDRILGVEWIPMIQGIGAVLHPTHKYLQSGRLMSTMTIDNWENLDPDQVSIDEVDGYLSQTRDTWKSSHCCEVYDEVLLILRKCNFYIQQSDGRVFNKGEHNNAWAGPLVFIYFLPKTYITLLHQRQPPALIIFSFFGALLHKLNDFWFLEGWGKEIVQVTSELLGSYWQPWITWPTKFTGLNEME